MVAASFRFTLCVGFLMALLPGAALAIDGVVLIDQSKALAGNVTPGDTPGFPITISQSGSYRLDGSLTVPDVNTNAIVITAPSVTLDLNGFSIVGSNVCTVRVTFGVRGVSCSAGSSATGIGILAFSSAGIYSLAIRNGTIRGMGAAGLQLDSFGSAIIENLHAESDGGYGIAVSGYSIVRNATAELNEYGIFFGEGLAINAIVQNNTYGIAVSSGRIIGASVLNNGTGLASSSTTSYVRSFFRGNTTDLGPNIFFAGSLPLNAGENICDNGICPGFTSPVF